MSKTSTSLDDIWAEAAKKFQEICGESLERGDIKSFDDVRKKIEYTTKEPDDSSDEQDDKWEKAKSVGLQSLKYMKMLLGAASQAAEFIPVPSAAANIAGSALSFVFDVPQKIRGYNEAVDGVFTEVSSSLSQFRIYQSIDNMNQPLLIEQIHLMMASIVKICAHVVKYRQGRRRDRFRRQFAAIFDDNKPLDAELSELRRLREARGDIEGTISLSLLVKTQADVAELLESFAGFAKTVDETYQGVQTLKEDNSRKKALSKIKDTLNIPWTVLLDTRTTQTCTNIAAMSLPGTGSWIWADKAFSSWKEGPVKAGERQVSNLLVVSGPASSGKTLATAQIIKHLEEEKGRTFVAHYFYLPQKGDDGSKYPVHTSLRYMAFQIARVDPTVRKSLEKACDSASTSLGARNTTSNLDSLWSEFKIGGSGSTYFLVFEGIENLDEKNRDMLLGFVSSSKLADDSAGRVRVLVSGTDKILDGYAEAHNAFRIDMKEYNDADMRIFIEDKLIKRSLLRHAKPGSRQQKARDNVIAKLPQKAAGSYSHLQFALDEVVRMLSSRTSFDELDKVLDQAMNSHETAIKSLQRSLTGAEIEELNELLKWVHFAKERMTVAELESAMLLYSEKESIGLLDDIINSKYLAILKIDDSPGGPFVEGQDGALDYLQKQKAHRSEHPKDKPVISMTINISNVEQEIVGHFLWDLAQKAIRDQFRFNLDSASNVSHARQMSIAVDEFEAHHALAMRAFKYLRGEPSEGTGLIGRYLFGWFPSHLGMLSQLHYEEMGYLMPDEQLEIGNHLYELFKDERLFKRHKSVAEQTLWYADEVEMLQKWLMDSAVVRRVPKQWREEVQGASSPVRGFLRPFVKCVIESWLRSHEPLSGEALGSYKSWVRVFIEVDDKASQPPQTPRFSAPDQVSSGSTNSDPPPVDWERVSGWCQSFLDLPESEVDSLWWQRIAQAAWDEGKENAELVMPLYQRALFKEDPSWQCHSGLSECFYQLDRITDAITEAELTMTAMGSKGCRPTPTEGDLMQIRFRLGELYQENGNSQQARQHFLIVSESSDAAWIGRGRVAHLNASLVNDAEEAKNILRTAFVTEKSEVSKVKLLKMVAKDSDHNNTIHKMFTIAKGDPELLKEIVSAIEKGTEPLEFMHDQATEISREEGFAEQEARGVLLYHRGMTVAYRMSSEGTNHVADALKFWEECRHQLRNIGGRVASTTIMNAIYQLASYYFQNLLKGQGLTEHRQALSKLADESSSVDSEDAAGFLAVLYARGGERDKAKEMLARQVKYALDILSDGWAENDFIGHHILFKCLTLYQDFDNAAAALTLMGAPDLVTNSLQFEDYDTSEWDEGEQPRIQELLKGMGRDVSQVVKAKVPDSSQQARRIEVAKDHIESLVDTDPTKAKLTAMLKARINALHETQASVMNAALRRYRRWCDGLGPPGTSCDNVADFDQELFHCIYCSDLDFCADCFGKLREQSVPAMRCSAAHMWLKMPRQGGDFYRGFDAKSIKMPVVRPVEGDGCLLEVCYEGDREIEELTLESWEQGLAKDWGIVVEES
ncbi:hypothetical protein KVR01_012048 [Diaporthe batatas]|uniref:uncharacterized protein n=1 Tax=Diaporthe batatas TaxID=748121 RepID=UPI001D053793|nr:uncharacterized protein KVR01_012048 [Diaporthe batatas]KAG8158287.1 hypothetical protein KVR01_012048 [Diaporthe batatas]